MKKRILFLVSTILIILTVVYISLKQNNNQQSIQSIKLSELQIKSDFYLTGVIEPKNVIDYKLDKNKGVISERKVNVGDTVEKGQVLYTYTNPDGDMAIQEAELSVKNAGKMVEQKKKESELSAQQYQSLLLNQQELDKNITDSKNEEEKNELTKTKSELTASITQAEIDNSSAESEIENANLEVEKANLELAKIQKT